MYQVELPAPTVSQEISKKARFLAEYLQINELGQKFTLEVNGQKFDATAYDCNGGMVIVTPSFIAFASSNPQTHKPDIQKYIPYII